MSPSALLSAVQVWLRATVQVTESGTGGRGTVWFPFPPLRGVAGHSTLTWEYPGHSRHLAVSTQLVV